MDRAKLGNDAHFFGFFSAIVATTNEIEGWNIVIATSKISGNRFIGIATNDSTPMFT